MKDERCCGNCMYRAKEFDAWGEYWYCDNEDSPNFEIEVSSQECCEEWDSND